GNQLRYCSAEPYRTKSDNQNKKKYRKINAAIHSPSISQYRYQNIHFALYSFMDRSGCTAQPIRELFHFPVDKYTPYTDTGYYHAMGNKVWRNFADCTDRNYFIFLT